MRTPHLALAPDEGGCVLVVGGGEIADRPDELINADEAGVAQRLALEDAEPDLDLIKPARAGGCEVEGDSRVHGEPLVVPLVGAQVVQDNVNVPLG